MMEKTLQLVKDEVAISRDYSKWEGIEYCNENMIDDIAGKFATYKQIEENKSLLEMAKLHMDSRAVLVIQERINVLEVQLLLYSHSKY